MKQKKKTRGRVEYPANLRERVKNLYFEHGNFSAVLRELKRRGFVSLPAVSTMTDWREAEGWLEQKDRLDLLKEPEILTGDELDKLLAEVQAMKNIVKDILKKLGVAKDKDAKQNSQLSQHLYAFNNLCQTEAKILEIKRRIVKEGGTETPVEVIFAALKKHPKLGRIMERSETISELRNLIAEEMMAWQRRELGIPQAGLRPEATL